MDIVGVIALTTPLSLCEPFLYDARAAAGLFLCGARVAGAAFHEVLGSPVLGGVDGGLGDREMPVSTL